MITRPIPVIRSVGGRTLACLVVLLAACGGGGGGNGANGMSATITVSGTTATGKALANARININCVQGSTSVSADQSGNYRATFGAQAPCLISSTSGATLLFSFAFAGGTFNVTPETDLLLSYIAAQLGTNQNGLVAGFKTNTRFQQALANLGDVLVAQTAVGQALQRMFGVTLAAPAFLTMPFTVGQPGVDADLKALLAANAIDANGEPAPAAVSLIAMTGAANPITPSPAPSPGGTGLGGTGSPGGMM